jgi:methylated-DNA-protein-cysteine methyltransferase-like protein
VSWAPVYRLVKSIPRGRVVTYGQLARALRLRGGARTAGRAMAACPAGVPWQRVVGAGGRLLPREPYASYQRQLLAREGVEFLGARVNLARHRWNPARRPAKSRRPSAL